MTKNKILFKSFPLFVACCLLFVICYLFTIDFLNAKEGDLEIPSYHLGELLVKFREDSSVYKFKFEQNTNLEEIIKNYENNSLVEYIEPNYTFSVSLIPSDPYFPRQDYLKQIKAPEAWTYETGSQDIIIAILDSGIDIDHPDLKDNIWQNTDEILGNGIDDDQNGYIDDKYGWDFIEAEPDPRPKFNKPYTEIGINHGTIVAGVAGALGDNNEGIIGVTWQATLMPLRVLDGQGIGDTLSVAQAVDYARLNGADIINLSFVGEHSSETLKAALKRAYEAGVLIVAAAGNEVQEGIDLDQKPMYPVCQDFDLGENWVIGVAGVDSADRKASFSNYGVKCIDVSAPSVSIYSTQYYNKYRPEFYKYYGGWWAGTSVSSPQVAGLAALVKSLKPNLSLSQLQDIITEYVDDIDNFNPLYAGKLGPGRINAYKAIIKTRAVEPELEEEKSPSEPKSKVPIKEKVITGASQGGGPHIRVFNEIKVESEFFAFNENFHGGVDVAVADLDQDGDLEIVTGVGKGATPLVRIFSKEGKLKSEFLAYNPNFLGGIRVTTGDVDSDGAKEIITGVLSGDGPHLKVFDLEGNIKSQFFAFEKSFTGGIDVASADLDLDGRAEIIVGAGKGREPEIRIFDFKGNLKQKFLTYPKFMEMGVKVASGDLDGDQVPEIISGTDFGAGPQVRVFDMEGRVKSQFFAYSEKFRGGVNVASGDIDSDGRDEIITGAGPTGGPHIRIFDNKARLKIQFFAYDEKFTGGVNVASGK